MKIKFKHIALIILAPMTCFVRAQTFTNVACAQGITFTSASLNLFGNGVSFYDFNKDGWDDLSFAVIGDTQRLMKE